MKNQRQPKHKVAAKRDRDAFLEYEREMNALESIPVSRKKRFACLTCKGITMTPGRKPKK